MGGTGMPEYESAPM